ncbi:MAG: hypothetical protein ABS52_17760 [Gemmatimonadetes bacterium SCN 70-22]|nr:MAG: hypothetical protein ABS52_17760 [Gemmatimonadetes bacterium SCN 70-22]
MSIATQRATVQSVVARRAAIVALAAFMVLPSDANAQQADSARAGVRAPGDSAAAPRRGEGRGTAGRRAPATRDSLAPPVSPGRAFLLSLAVPGLGQSRLNRPTAGAVYFTAEAVWLAMLGKAAHDLQVAKAHANDVIVASYKVDPATGKPIIVNGKYVPLDTLRSRYADPIEQGAANAQQQRSRVKARKLHFEDWIAMLAFNHLFSGADAFVSSQLWDLPAQVEIRALPRGGGIGVSIPFR